MKFHEYNTSKTHCINELKRSGKRRDLQRVQKLSPVEFLQHKTRHVVATYSAAVRQSFECFAAGLSETETPEQTAARVAAAEAAAFGIRHALGVIAELDWFEDNRPFYNVYPIVEKLVKNTKLDIPVEHLNFPNRVICFRFPKGHEPFGIKTALIKLKNFDAGNAVEFKPMFDITANTGGQIKMLAAGAFEVVDDSSRFVIQVPAPPPVPRKDGQPVTVEYMLQLAFACVAGHLENEKELPIYTQRMEFLFRLAVLVSLIAAGDDLVTPAVLASEQDAYDLETDEAARRWMEERAAKIQGRGFNFGKALQQMSDVSPHWRNPHLALFWTGAGRKTPVLKTRAGSLVVSKHLADVPSGYNCPINEEQLPGEKPENVYFLRDPARGYVKIGRTRRTIEDRQKESKTFVPGGLRLIGYIATGDCVELETRIHREYGHRRRENEFFEIDDTEVQEILIQFGGIFCPETN